MVNIVIEVSKYLLILLIAAYTYWNFSYFRFRDPWQQGRVCVRQNVAMFLLHFVAYAVLFLKSEDERVILFYLAQVVFLAVYLGLYKVFYPLRSRLLVNNMCMLLCIGFVILTRLDFDKALRQFVIVAVSALITWIIPFILERVWQLANIPWVYGFAGLALLIVVWIIGNNSFGAQLSVNIAGIAFQPSEFVKILFVFFTACMFYRDTEFKTIIETTVMAAAYVLVLVLSKDLGSALIFFLAYLTMLFVATGSYLYLFSGLLCGSGASVVAYQLFAHVRTRVAAWKNPWADIDNRGYQITQSLFAIGTGGWFGMVLICLGCFLQFVLLAARMQALFYKLIAFGLAMVYAVQVFLTVGGVTKFIPSTGVTLPLVSYGGSSVLSTFIIFGVIQGLYILKQNDEEDYEKDID